MSNIDKRSKKRRCKKRRSKNELIEKLDRDKEKFYELIEKLDRDKEKIHDETIEELSRDKVKRKQEIEKLRQKISDANSDINKTNMSLKKLVEFNNRYKYLKELDEKSEPSDEMKEYQNVYFFIFEISGRYLVINSFKKNFFLK